MPVATAASPRSVPRSVLVVDDEPAIREMLRFTLNAAGYAVREAGDAETAQSSIANATPDLVLLDWMLPGRSGVELARTLKRDPRYRELPIILLTAKGEEPDKVQGLNAGADDYVTKPFSVRELLARMSAVLRRSTPESGGEVLSFEGLSLDLAAHRATAGAAPLELGPTEFRLLRFFMSHPERVYSRATLLDHVWGSGVFIEERTVDVHIRRLRKALSATGHDRLVQTVRGSGYRFSAQA